MSSWILLFSMWTKTSYPNSMTNMAVPGFANKESCLEAGNKHAEVITAGTLGEYEVSWAYSCVATKHVEKK